MMHPNGPLFEPNVRRLDELVVPGDDAVLVRRQGDFIEEREVPIVPAAIEELANNVRKANITCEDLTAFREHLLGTANKFLNYNQERLDRELQQFIKETGSSAEQVISILLQNKDKFQTFYQFTTPVEVGADRFFHREIIVQLGYLAELNSFEPLPLQLIAKIVDSKERRAPSTSEISGAASFALSVIDQWIDATNLAGYPPRREEFCGSALKHEGKAAQTRIELLRSLLGKERDVFDTPPPLLSLSVWRNFQKTVLIDRLPPAKILDELWSRFSQSEDRDKRNFVSGSSISLIKFALTFEVLSKLTEKKFNSPEDFFRAYDIAVKVLHVALFPKIWTRIDFIPARDSRDSDARKNLRDFVENAQKLINEFLGSVGSKTLVSSTVVEILSSYDRNPAECDRILLAIRVLGRFFEGFQINKENREKFRNAVHALANLEYATDFSLRALPEALHTEDLPRSFFKNPEQVLVQAQQLLKLADRFRGKKHPTVVLRTASELFYILTLAETFPALVDDKNQARDDQSSIGKRYIRAALSANRDGIVEILSEYFTLFGVNPAPTLFLAFVATKLGEPIDRVLTTFLNNRFKRAGSSDSITRHDQLWLAPLARQLAEEPNWKGHFPGLALRFTGFVRSGFRTIANARASAVSCLESIATGGNLDIRHARAVRAVLSGRTFRELYQDLEGLDLSSPITTAALLEKYSEIRMNLSDSFSKGNDLDKLVLKHPFTTDIAVISFGLLNSRLEHASKNPFTRRLGAKRGTDDLSRITMENVISVIRWASHSDTTPSLEVKRFKRSVEDPEFVQIPLSGPLSSTLTSIQVNEALSPYYDGVAGSVKTTIEKLRIAIIDSRATTEIDLSNLKMLVIDALSEAEATEIAKTSTIEELVIAVFKLSLHAESIDADPSKAQFRISPLLMDLLEGPLLKIISRSRLPDHYDKILDGRIDTTFKVGIIHETILEAARAWEERILIREKKKWLNRTRKLRANGISKAERPKFDQAKALLKAKRIEQFVLCMLREPLVRSYIALQEPVVPDGDKRNTIEISTMPSRGMPLFFCGQNTDSCIVGLKDPRAARSNILMFPLFCKMVDSDQPVIVGTVGVIVVEAPHPDDPARSARYMMLRLFNPSETFLERVETGSVFEGIIDNLAKVGKEFGCHFIVSPDAIADGDGLSNRRKIIDYVRRVYAKSKTVTLDRVATRFHTTRIRRPALIIRAIE